MNARLLETILEATSGTTALPVVLSISITLFVVVMLRVGFNLYKSGEVVVLARRIADLNPRVVKLTLTFENLQRKERRLTNLHLEKKEGKAWANVGEIAAMPIQSDGVASFLQKEGDVYSFCVLPNSRNIVVVEFALTEPCDTVYLTAINKKGKTVRAKLSLLSQGSQQLFFHKSH